MAAASKGTKSQGARSSRAEQSIQAFRDAIEKSVTISRDLLQEVVDDAVKRGRMTRGDAEELVSRVVARSRDQVEEILRQLEDLAAQVRDAGAAAANPRRAAERAADRAKREIGDARGRARATADRARRRAGLPGFPISGYDDLTVAQIEGRLETMKPTDLRKVRQRERAGKARKGVLRAVDRRLSAAG